MIAVFGASGLLGSHLCARHPKDTIPVYREDCDLTDQRSIRACLKKLQPDVVINCAGVVPRSHAYHTANLWAINAGFPCFLDIECADLAIRFVHISTDCVFAGDRHNQLYFESDIHDAPDPYGRSKAMGEHQLESHLIVRTSFIGWPDPKLHGLLAWFGQRPNPVPGFTNWFWNGMTTLALCDELVDLAYQPALGIRHIFNNDPYSSVSKCQVLEWVEEAFGWGKKVKPVEFPHYSVDRRLGTEFYRDPQEPYILKKQLQEMAEWAKTVKLIRD